MEFRVVRIGQIQKVASKSVLPSQSDGFFCRWRYQEAWLDAGGNAQLYPKWIKNDEQRFGYGSSDGWLQCNLPFSRSI